MLMILSMSQTVFIHQASIGNNYKEDAFRKKISKEMNYDGVYTISDLLVQRTWLVSWTLNQIRLIQLG